MKKQLSASITILYCCLVAVGVVVAASSQPNNLRGGIKGEGGYDFIDFNIPAINFDLNDLPCNMLTDPRHNSECIHQGKRCRREGKECYVVTVSSQPYYGCGDPNTCDSNTDRSSSQTTTTSTTTPACLQLMQQDVFPPQMYRQIVVLGLCAEVTLLQSPIVLIRCSSVLIGVI